MAVPLGGRHYYGNWEYATPEMIRNRGTFDINNYSEEVINEAIDTFKAYVDARPYYTFERNLDGFNQESCLKARIICEPKYLRIVRPYAKEVHQKFIDAKKQSK